MKLNKLVLIIIVSAQSLFAQDIGTTEVKVVEGFQPTIPEASRLNENAVFSDTVERNRTQTYDVVDADLKSNYKTKPLKAAKVKDDKIPKLYQSEISLGTGYRVGSKLSALYNSTRSKDMSYGVLFNHFNNNVKVDGKQAGRSNNNLNLYAKKIKKNKIYIANLDYERIGAFTYGNSTTDYNRFAYTRFSSSYINTDKAHNKMIRDVSFFASDLNEMSENQIHLSSNLSKKINNLPFNLEINFNNYLNYNNKDSKYESMDEKILELLPSTSITKYDIDFDIGMELDYSFDKTLGYSPEIKATKELVKGVLLVYGGLRHSDQRNSLKSLSDENPYIHTYGTNQSILGSSNDSLLHELRFTDIDELYVSMRNMLGKDEVFEGSLAYGIVRNFPHFVGIANDNYNRFQVDYLDVKQLHANVNYDRKINNIMSIDASVDYFNWDKEVSHKPDLVIDIKIPINLRNKIKANPSFSYKGGRISQQEKLPALFYVNIGVFYSYSKQLSAYLQFNNITNSKQELWSDYKDVGFNGVFGISYSF